MKEGNITCELYILQKGDILRMTPKCCKPEVNAGIEACRHKMDERFDRYTVDGSLTCPRAIATLELSPLDERVLRK